MLLNDFKAASASDCEYRICKSDRSGNMRSVVFKHAKDCLQVEFIFFNNKIYYEIYFSDKKITDDQLLNLENEFRTLFKKNSTNSVTATEGFPANSSANCLTQSEYYNLERSLAVIDRRIAKKDDISVRIRDVFEEMVRAMQAHDYLKSKNLLAAIEDSQFSTDTSLIQVPKDVLQKYLYRNGLV